MAVRRKGWSELSPAYRSRLQRNGITESLYNRGTSLKTARGHNKTPEHGLKEALRNPRRYKKYIAKKTPTGGGISPEQEARRINAMLDKAYRNFHNKMHTYIKYNDNTVKANVYGGVTSESGQVDGMVYGEALWTSTADAEEIRANAREQYKGNPWWYH
jgi:hypothetical protein